MKISNNGRVELKFTNKMSFPTKRNFVQLNSETNNSLIDLAILKGEEEVPDDFLTSWEIVSVSATLIEIDLHFKDPLLVSQGDEYHRLFVELALA